MPRDDARQQPGIYAYLFRRSRSPSTATRRTSLSSASHSFSRNPSSYRHNADPMTRGGRPILNRSPWKLLSFLQWRSASIGDLQIKVRISQVGLLRYFVGRLRLSQAYSTCLASSVYLVLSFVYDMARMMADGSSFGQPILPCSSSNTLLCSSLIRPPVAESP